MINSKKYFEGIDADTEIEAMEDTYALNIENMRISSDEFSRGLLLKNIPSTTQLYNLLPAGTNKRNGTARDYRKNRLIWFNRNSGREDGIYCYDIPAQTTYKVLLSSNCASPLNFTDKHKVDRNARVYGDLLLFTDNNNEPRCINIERGIKLNQPSYVTYVTPYVAPIPYTSLTVIVRPPIYRLQATKITDAGFNANFIANNAYQFYYRYWYKDYQYSVLSTFSQLMPYNYAEETFNAINLKMPFGEDVPDEAQQVDFCVRYGNTGKSFVIRSWNKNNSYDALAITSHNANAVQLSVTFYDNISGVAIDDITANTSFDAVTLKAKTLDNAKLRLFLANVLKGYNTPPISSLTVTLGTYDTGGAGSYTADWKYFYISYVDNFGNVSQMAFYYAYVSTLSITSYYYSAYQSATAPPTVNAADADVSWQTETQLAAYIQRNTPPPSGTHWVNGPYNFYSTGDDTNLIFTVDLNGLQFFKSSSAYSVSVAFYDRYRRKCGVVNDVAQALVPDRTSSQTVFATSISWSLNNITPLVEIPDWAYYYQILITKSLITRFFEQIFCLNSNYVVKNQDNTFTYGDTFGDDTYAIAIDITNLYNAGLGYTFNEGDLCRVYFSGGTNVVLPVIGQDGNFVLLQPQDLSTLGTGVSFLIELYTPYKPSATEPYFETGDMMDILNPTTLSRTYSTTTGSINGDCYAIERLVSSGGSQYFVEAMSPNDKVWQIWQTDRGWVNFFDTIGQQQKEDSIDYSDTYIIGTKTNGLNKFNALNTESVGLTSGEIQKLQLTNKQQEDGTVMLCICTSLTMSIYLGETQLYDVTQQAFVAKADNVIGSINQLKNERGTINPESVIEYSGVVWWVDVIHGKVPQYAQDGITDVSDYKMRRFFDRFSKRYLALGASGVEALCGFSDIQTTIDPSANELLIIIPQTEINTVTSGIPVGFAPALPSYSTLPSYATSIQNRFEIYDGQPKTLVYNFEKNKWAAADLWLPDGMEYIGNKLFGFKNGALYLFNENTSSYNTIFGVQYPQRICFAVNSLSPSAIKDLFDIAIESNAVPTYVVGYSNYPYVQITDLTASDFTTKQGLQLARWFRDRLSPNSSGTPDERLYKGDIVECVTPFVMIEFNEYSSALFFKFVNIGFDISAGLKQTDGINKPKN